MRSKLIGTIFREELKDVYIRKEEIYKRSIQTAQDKLLELTTQMEQRACPDTGIEQMMLELSQQLSQLSGKHQYGYLPKPVKATVDAIVDRLAQLPEVAACYAQWNQVKDELVRFHNQNPRQHLPLSQQKGFRVLLNAVIREAENMPTRSSGVLHEEPPDLEETDTPEYPAHSTTGKYTDTATDRGRTAAGRYAFRYHSSAASHEPHFPSRRIDLARHAAYRLQAPQAITGETNGSGPQAG